MIYAKFSIMFSWYEYDFTNYNYRLFNDCNEWRKNSLPTLVSPFKNYAFRHSNWTFQFDYIRLHYGLFLFIIIDFQFNSAWKVGHIFNDQRYSYGFGYSFSMVDLQKHNSKRCSFGTLWLWMNYGWSILCLRICPLSGRPKKTLFSVI